MFDRSSRESVDAALKMATSADVSSQWRVTQPYPSGGVRKSKERGNNGWDLATRLEYEPGDNVRDIDWPATAQTGGQQVLVSHKLEPRNLSVYIVADVRMSMNFGTIRTTKRQLCAELTACVIKSAAKSEDKVGFLAFAPDYIEPPVTLRSPQKAMLPALVSVIEGGNKSPSNSKSKKLSGFMQALQHLPKRKAIVIVISDFLNLSAGDREALKKTALAHDVICMCVQDRRERELPAATKLFGFDVGGIYTLRDLESGAFRSIWLSQANRQKFAENFRRRQSELEAFFRQAHIDFGVFSTEEGVAGLPKLTRLLANHR